VYWTDLDNGRPRVERCFLDGSQQTEISDMVNPMLIRNPAIVTVDPETSNVFWAETDEDRILVYHYETGEVSDFAIQRKLWHPQNDSVETEFKDENNHLIIG